MKTSIVTVNRPMVVLDGKLTASQARVSNEVKQILTSLITEAVVKVFREYFYLVDFGPGAYPQHHIVSHDLYCSCALEADCPAVTAVKYYLEKGVCDSAKISRLGFFPAAPHFCPLCSSSKVYYEPRLSSRTRGAGWRCATGGTTCYWKHRGIVLQVAYAEKWKRLGIDPETFKVGTVFPFKDDYDPERDPEFLCSNRMPVAP
jgi:hypothetical protein